MCYLCNSKLVLPLCMFETLNLTNYIICAKADYVVLCPYVTFKPIKQRRQTDRQTDKRLANSDFICVR